MQAHITTDVSPYIEQLLDLESNSDEQKIGHEEAFYRCKETRALMTHGQMF
jgi:hypothetical protein